MTLSNTAPQHKKNRKGFIVPEDFFSRLKVKAFLLDYGYESIGHLCKLWSILWNEETNIISYSHLRVIADDIKLTEEQLKSLIKGLLFADILTGDSESFWSEDILQDSTAYKQKQEVGRASRLKYLDKELDLDLSSEDKSTSDLQGTFKVPSRSPVLMHNANVGVNELSLERNPKENLLPKPRLKTVLVPKFPQTLDNFECRQAWDDWLEHKKSRGESYKSAKSQEIKLREWESRPEKFVTAINFSIGNNWAGIFEKRAENAANGPPNDDSPEAKLDRMKKLIEEEATWR